MYETMLDLYNIYEQEQRKSLCILKTALWVQIRRIIIQNIWTFTKLNSDYPKCHNFVR